VLLFGSVLLIRPRPSSRWGLRIFLVTIGFIAASSRSTAFASNRTRPSAGPARQLQGLGARAGWWWTNPIMTKSGSRCASARSTAKTKVNDKDGNPVEIAAVIMWRVHTTGAGDVRCRHLRAVRRGQSETAVRHLASQYPYDGHDDETVSLRGNMDLIAETLPG
jgi:hypothetical protein